MKLKIGLIVLIVLLSNHTFANTTGVGAMVGNPIGLNLKHWLSDTQAVDGGLGMTILGKKSRASLHSDYLFHSENALVFNDDYPLDLYYGLGGRMKFADEILLGARIPVGVSHKVEASDMFAELAPIIDFVGRTGIELHLIIGARYYFN